MPNDDKVKALLADLGKSTLRGVKKCPKCGTYNGTRGLSCKNKACDVVFKEAGEKRKQTTEVCRLITGNNTQIFSVRIRDKGPDYRGFVQLPLVQNNMIDSEAALVTQTGALCFVETCQRTFTTKVLRCHEKEMPPIMTSCQHIQAAVRCCTVAQPLNISDVVLNSLSIPQQMKQNIWQLKSETCGPLVQRVSKNIMAVKCKANSKHLLGYLHVSFFVSKSNSKESQVYYTCSCPTHKMKNSSKIDDGSKGDPLRRCIHYYACVAAFTSEPKLSEEFGIILGMEEPKDSLIGLELQNSKDVERADDIVDEDNEDVNGRQQLVTILGDVSDCCEVEVEVLPDEASFLQQYTLSDEIAELQGLEVIQNLDTTATTEPLVNDPSQMVLVNQKSLNQLLSSDIQQQPLLKFGQTNGVLGGSGGVKRRRDEAKSALVSLQEGFPAPRKQVNSRHKINQQKGIIVAEGNENTVYQSFIQWLASVTERINQTMHYQFDGKPAPLVFHTPQAFFNCLRERISVVGSRKRLPNQTVVFNNKDSLPLGTYTKYSWHINNILHCKLIFETPLMPLCVTRSFIENQDGTYEPFDFDAIDETFSKTENSPRIKPLEHKTFLKVGNTTKDQITPTPFIIEWMPDVLPVSHIGELRLVFQFGHIKPCL